MLLRLSAVLLVVSVTVAPTISCLKLLSLLRTMYLVLGMACVVIGRIIDVLLNPPRESSRLWDPISLKLDPLQSIFVDGKKFPDQKLLKDLD